MMTCKWCDSDISEGEERCPVCNASVNDVVLPKKTLKEQEAELSQKNKRHIVRETPFDFTETGNLAIGIDPGARHTAICVVDGDRVVMSSCYKRDDEDSSTQWALKCAKMVIKHKEKFPQAVLAVEGINDPKGFSTKGKKAPLNPRDIIRTGIVLGAIVQSVPTIDVIPPDLHGDLDASFYPDVLNGRRPKDLLGDYANVSTRRHEKSAYDVAKKMWKKNFTPTD